MFLFASVLLAVFVVPDPWGWPVVVLGAAIEVSETLFWMRLSRRAPAKVGPETLVGTMGRVITPCRPRGEVRLQGESWRARCEAGADVGDRVRVQALDGLTLVVEPADRSP